MAAVFAGKSPCWLLHVLPRCRALSVSRFGLVGSERMNRFLERLLNVHCFEIVYALPSSAVQRSGIRRFDVPVTL